MRALDAPRARRNIGACSLVKMLHGASRRTIKAESAALHSYIELALDAGADISITEMMVSCVSTRGRVTWRAACASPRGFATSHQDRACRAAWRTPARRRERLWRVTSALRCLRGKGTDGARFC